ncbi:MAG: hypothetical protein M3Q06_11285 [Bacteroidota bacterium]|nr:hypothetical protein [Bacteroidota bacterium]
MANNEKNRKSEAQERFEEADNAGRFAGNDADSQVAKQNALRAGAQDTTGYDSGPVENQESNRNSDQDGTDEAAHRGSADTDDFAGNADNVNADSSRPLQDDELDRARNKANESKGVEDSR